MINAQGLRIATYAIRAKEPIGAMIIVHGFRVSARFEFIGPPVPGTAHIEWDGSVLSELHHRGVSLYLLDLQGHGQSDSARDVRAHVERFDDYPRDVLQFARELVIPDLRCHISSETRPPPLFLYGQSLGGGIVVRASQLCQGVVADGWPLHGLICGAPLISVAPEMPQAVVRLFYLIASVIPTRQSHVASPPNGIDDAVYQRELRTEPTHYHGNPRWGFLRELKRLSEGFLAPGGGADALESVRCTALLAINSYSDTLVSWRGAEALFERACHVRRKTLVLLRGIQPAIAPVDARSGVVRTVIDQVEQTAVDNTIWSSDVLELPLWHNLTREPQGKRLARAIALWVQHECELAAARCR